MTISFHVSLAEAELIGKIATRFTDIAKRVDPDIRIDRLALIMDLTACHASGTPLDLQRLLDADDFNVVHDVGGIRSHIDRETSQLGGCFLPRFSTKN